MLLVPDAGSPKFQLHEVGVPVDVSVKVTVVPMTGVPGGET